MKECELGDSWTYRKMEYMTYQLLVCIVEWQRRVQIPTEQLLKVANHPFFPTYDLNNDDDDSDL